MERALPLKGTTKAQPPPLPKRLAKSMHERRFGITPTLRTQIIELTSGEFEWIKEPGAQDKLVSCQGIQTSRSASVSGAKAEVLHSAIESKH